jgi:hypothetical protein
VVFIYHDKKKEGTGYDESSVKTFKKVVGKATEDTPLEHLAKLVFGQLARRDVWVVDAEIYEYTKKKVSFKETKDGILLKNKKFGFDMTCDSLQIEESVVDPEVVPEIVVQEKPKKVVIIPPAKKESVIRYELYDPHPDIAAVAKSRVTGFTLGKKYPIYSESASGQSLLMGMNYLTEDDNGNRRTLNDKHFTPVVGVLENGFDNEFRPAEQRSTLSHQNDFDKNMPAIHTLGRK